MPAVGVSDIPASRIGRGVPHFGAPPPGYVAGRGRGADGLSSGVPNTPQDARAAAESAIAANAAGGGAPELEGVYPETNSDEFSGYQQSLFAGRPYDEDDKEADMVHAANYHTRMTRRLVRKSTCIYNINTICLCVCA